jgi:predicted SnoaL-like aldol condensation-catalyzing enzyme
MSTEANKLAFRSIPEVLFNSHDLSKIDDYFAENYTERAPLPPGFPNGIDAVRMYFSELFTAFPDLHTTVDLIVGEGDFVAGHITVSGTNLGSFMGIPASGRKMSWTESHFGRMVDGKLAEH